MLGELNMNTNKSININIDEEKIKAINEDFTKSLEEYVFDAINVVRNQISFLLKEPVNDSIRLSDSIRDLGPDRINLIVSTIVKMNRRKLNEKFKEKLQKITQVVNSLNQKLRLDELINFDSFYQKTQQLMEKFDQHLPILSRTIRNKYKKKLKKKIKSCGETDFFSDTEILSRSHKCSKNKIDRLLHKFKNLDFDEDDNQSDSSSLSSEDESDFKILSKKYSYSDTLLYQDNAEMEISFLAESARSDISSDEDIDGNYADQSSDSYSNSNSFSSNILTEDMEQEVDNLYRILEHPDSDQERPEIENLPNDKINEDEDCVIICENDYPSNSKTSKKLNKCLEIIDKLISSNKEINRPRPPITLGMKCLALKDRQRFKWKLGHITRITDNKLLEIDPSSTGNYSQTHRMICNSKYTVIFESDDEDDNEMEELIDDNISRDFQEDQEVIIDTENSNNSAESSDNDIIDCTDDTSSKKRKIRSKLKNSTQTNGPYVKKRTHPNTNDNKCVELDAKSVAFLDNYECIPNIRINKISKRALFEPKSRVVTLYQLKVSSSDKTKVLYNTEYMSSGTILEVPSLQNFRRYLVLFDNGIASYVKPDHLFPIFDLFGQPLDLLNMDQCMFLNNYFRVYPERTMVRLQRGDTIQVFFNSKWNQTRVLDVEGSLASFEIRGNFINQQKTGQHYSYSIKLHRGSYCLSPMYEQFKIELDNSIKNYSKLTPFQEYIKDRIQNTEQFGISLKKYLSFFASSLFPNVEIKAKTSKSNKTNEPNHKTQGEKVIQGQLKHLNMDQLMRDEIIPFITHPCTNACVAKWENRFEEVKGVNPLLMPVLHGWQRHIGNISKNSTTMTKRFIRYVSPCGRTLRSTAEIDHYLYLTNSKLTIDMFTTDCIIHTDREFEANAKNLKINDIANNLENVPISVVNCVDLIEPDKFVYSAKRIPLEGVPLNTEPELMEGCNCTDNCRDRTKCACWRKTFEATLFSSNQMNTNVGYRGRRLMDSVNTGIFECNSNCKCDCRCSNRVVQNGISVRLQLFKTNSKGWGLRCLDDIPKGTFICNYSGELITEDMSDIRGREFGDEYFAELDFVDYLKQFKPDSSQEPHENERMESDFNDQFNPKSRRNNQRSRDYQRPKQQQHQKKALGLNETDYIVLDSDEDEQDRNTISDVPASKKEVDYNRSRALSRQQKDKRVATFIDSNRFFTNRNNIFFWENYMRDSSIFIMDAKKQGNIGRYFNHSCAPNIFVQNVFVDTYDLRFPWIAFFTSNSIKAGTELCWDYNYTIGSVQDRVLYCHCNSANCRGRLL
ncbi:unnamed protein product [Brachionus calyciflorus]|uniref:Uncharacterized protein n=1 Tax=Brachionus calyciflorus TaxID=104777 RepID=A0A813N528_9BILA|nr:unnamed protein product [Brachionus calyciflorus]